jgi:hypothetical protein
MGRRGVSRAGAGRSRARERTLRQPAVEPRPRAPVDGLLLVLNRLGDDLGVEVVVQHRRQLRLDREGFAQELLVELLARLLDHEHAAAARVLGRPAGAAHHLEQVGHRVVHVAVVAAIVRLDRHDDDHVGRQRDAPCGVLWRRRGKARCQLKATVPAGLAHRRARTLLATRTWIAPDSNRRSTMRLSDLERASW